LKKRRDFLTAAKGGRFHTERMTVQGRPRDACPSEGLRLGFTITKRAGHATERNRMRRRLKSAAGEAGARHRHSPVDVVVIARRDCLHADYAVLVEDLARALTVVTRPKGPRSSKQPLSPAAADDGRERSHA
jgi:ribonuclease P protein component